MKIILSRKGFDSAAGGCASPIFDNGSFFSLPILQPPSTTESHNRTTFSDINFTYPIGKVVQDLTKHYIRADSIIHFDPDLRSDSLPRNAGWRPLFGQASAAQSHLAQHGIGKGDIFLFYGWFRGVEQVSGVYRFKRNAPDLHVMFGWLEIGEVWRLGLNRTGVPDWADLHPHITTEFNPSNTVYVAADQANSAGAFPRVTDELVLTCPGENRSEWRLPKWFHPVGKKSSLSYHSNPSRWRCDEEYCYLTNVARGQEFVLDTSDYPEAEGWVRGLIANNGA
jgi:hypothetical protein